jgi:hypothetical protein
MRLHVEVDVGVERGLAEIVVRVSERRSPTLDATAYIARLVWDAPPAIPSRSGFRRRVVHGGVAYSRGHVRALAYRVLR